MARTGMYVLQGIVPADVAAAPFDVKIIDIYKSNGTLFSQGEVAQMGGGPGSALLLGYFSIGEAETYRPYFSSIPAAALGPQNTQWAGNYEIAYWTPEWRAVATAYIDQMIALGYDGVMFDVVDEYEQAWAIANAPGGAAGAAQAMVDLVAYLADYAHAKVPNFKIWANNGEGLLSNSTYFSHIDGMIRENLYYTDSGAKQSAASTQWHLNLLQPMIAAGKDVIAIEYVSDAAKIADVQAKAAQAGIGSYTTNVNLVGASYTGVLPGQIMHDDWSGYGITPSPDQVVTGNSNANTLNGWIGNDTIKGLGGNDTLNGGAGNDWLYGGTGNDKLTGGTGNDTFVFAESGIKNFDTITDFTPGSDRIGLDAKVFTKAGAVGGLTDAAFWTGAAAHDATDRVIYNPTTGAIFYDPDGTGLAAQVQIATVTAGTNLNFTDIFVL